jgi:thiol-disulfide isomerase/thioredoxin
MTPPTAAPNLHIFCLCAQWCVICRDFEPAFQRLATDHPEHRWLSLDIEDHDALLADIDIENFPTVVILNQAKQVCFAGTIEPRIDSLQRLMQSAQANDLHLPAQSAQAWQALATL